MTQDPPTVGDGPRVEAPVASAAEALLAAPLYGLRQVE